MVLYYIFCIALNCYLSSHSRWFGAWFRVQKTHYNKMRCSYKAAAGTQKLIIASICTTWSKRCRCQQIVDRLQRFAYFEYAFFPLLQLIIFNFFFHYHMFARDGLTFICYKCTVELCAEWEWLTFNNKNATEIVNLHKTNNVTTCRRTFIRLTNWDEKGRKYSFIHVTLIVCFCVFPLLICLRIYIIRM